MRDQELQAAPNGVFALERVRPYGVTRAACLLANIPSGAAGFIYGCVLHVLDGSTGATVQYINTGTSSSCTFTVSEQLSGLLATTAEVNRVADASTRIVTAGASLTVSQLLHDGKTIAMPAACAVTLPAMTGSGSRYRFVCQITASAVTITATGAHLFGSLIQSSDAASGIGLLSVTIVSTGKTVITLDGTTQGGVKGDWVEIEDVATNVGVVRGQLTASGSEATPYS